MVCVVSLFGNSVDATSSKTALANIERSDHHLDFLDGIHRNRIGIRLTTVCTRRSQPENIIAHRTVDLETVITVIGAGKRDPSVFGGHGHRHILYDIIYIAVDRRSLLYPSCRKIFGCTDIRFCISCDYHFSQLLRTGIQGRIQDICIAQFQPDIRKNSLFITDIRNLHFIGSSGTHSLDRVTAIHIRYRTIHGSGWFVYRYHRSSYHILILIVDNFSAQCRSCHLSFHGEPYAYQNTYKKADNFFHTEICF